MGKVADAMQCASNLVTKFLEGRVLRCTFDKFSFRYKTRAFGDRLSIYSVLGGLDSPSIDGRQLARIVSIEPTRSAGVLKVDHA